MAALLLGIVEVLTLTGTMLRVLPRLEKDLLTLGAAFDRQAHSSQQCGEEIPEALTVKWRDKLVIDKASLILRIALNPYGGGEVSKREGLCCKERVYVLLHICLKLLQLRH